MSLLQPYLQLQHLVNGLQQLSSPLKAGVAETFKQCCSVYLQQPLTAAFRGMSSMLERGQTAFVRTKLRVGCWLQ
jgi:hypothetical protein